MSRRRTQRGAPGHDTEDSDRRNKADGDRDQRVVSPDMRQRDAKPEHAEHRTGHRGARAS